MDKNIQNKNDATDEFLKFFDDWIEVKKRMDKIKSTPTIDEGDIWWCGIGENVGVEICGKSRRFSRPVLILKKLSKFCFLGVPLTTKQKTGAWYVSFTFRDNIEVAALCQIRVMSVFRLYDKMGRLPTVEFGKVKNGFDELYK